MKKIIILFMLSMIGSSRAEQPIASMNLALHRKLMASAGTSDRVNILVKGKIHEIKDFVLHHQAIMIGSAGDIACLRISIQDVALLLQQPFVSRIESYPHHFRTLNDTMRTLCRVDEVQQGQAPLTQGYDGSGVIMGYIDSGIDLMHPDFQDSLGKTRVQFLWDMLLPTAPNTPQPYGYGQEWNKQQIDSGLAVAHTGQAEYGHGTYVAGIGSGNGRAVGHFKGVAPATDLIIVNYDFYATDTISRLANAVEYIFNKAQVLGKPCVINASLGDYYGSHDGLDLESQYISYLVNQQPGRVVVAAAGNVGIMAPFHVGRESVAGDTVFTWFQYNSGINGAYIQIFADTAHFNQVKFAIGADQVNPNLSYRGRTVFTGIASTMNTVLNRTLYNGLNRLCTFQTLGTRSGAVYSLEIFVMPDSANYNWRFITTGNGHFDSWTFDWLSQNLPSDTIFPDMVHYHAPDTNQSIVSGIACLDNVITVGNYFNTDRHLDVDSILQITATDKPRQLADNSSRGPTRDNRIKPDICAPGHHIISAGVLSLIPGMISTQPYKVALGGYHVTGGGTSASAPVVAGIAALFLQQNPAANWSDVKAAITGCAVQDQYTWGPQPNNAWGYGKASAYEALTVCNFVGISNATNTISNTSIFPNPASDYFKINLPRESEMLPFELVMLDIEGRIVHRASVQGDQVLVDTRAQSPGVYRVRLYNQHSLIEAGKLLIIH